MSLALFQTAVAELLRQPGPDRSALSFAEILSWNLTDGEVESLVTLAADPEFNQYGRDQRQQRWLATRGKIPRTRQMLGEERVRQIWTEVFDPRHTTVPTDPSTRAASYTLAFLDDLLRTATPEHAAVLTLERAEVELAQTVFEPLALVLDAVLTHGEFRLLDLTHDVTGPLPLPEVPTRLVLTRTGPGRRPRTFVIDTGMLAFLRGQVASGPVQPPTLPLLGDLRTMGLLA